MGRIELEFRILINLRPIVAWFLPVACLFWGPNASGEQVVTHTIASERLAGNLLGDSPSKELIVHLPQGYNQGDQRYPVVYWFPGAGHRSTIGIDLASVDREFSSGRSDDAIVVFMPSLTNYGSSAYLSSDAFGDWEGFMTAEVIPFIDQTYRTHGTAAQRGIMGFSLGGFTSLMLPILHPNTFGAVGMNDPSTSFTSGAVRTVEEIPPDVELDEEFDFDAFYAGFPDTVEGFSEAPLVQSLYGQIAARLSPNPKNPLAGDLPFNELAGFTAAAELWRDYDLLNPDSVELHRQAFESMSTLSVTLPLDSPNSPWNRELVRVLQEAGLPAQGIEVEGEHNERWGERFTQLLSNVTYAMRGVEQRALAGDSYVEDFDSLGLNDVDGQLLPTGWSVTDNFGYVFRDRTNTAFAGGNVELIGQQPYILNAGAEGDEDRTLAVYVPSESQGTTIQFLADVSDIQANALQLEFDMEAWAHLDQGVVSAGEATFDVMLEFDSGQGDIQVIDLGGVSLGLASDPAATNLLDGNRDENRRLFVSEVLMAPLGEADSLTVSWTTDGLGVSRGWVFGLDNVSLSFLLFGDLNDDGLLTAADIDMLSEAVRAGDPAVKFDLNGDASVDGADHSRWVLDLAGTNFGDADLDQDVDFADFLTLSNAFGSTAGWEQGDFDGDGLVGFGDFLLLSNNFSGTPANAAVPEPGSTALWIVATLFLWRRRFNCT